MASGRPDYTSQALIKGNCTGVGILTVAVDAAGNILGVLKGDYAGSLKTLAVDNQGRMLAVLTDPEDVFGNPHYMGAAELAARIGSPAAYDRRGQVVFMDPGGLNKNAYSGVTSGSGSAFTECGTWSALAGLCYKLAAGPDDGHYQFIEKRCPRLSDTKCGLESVVSIDVNAGQYDFKVAAYDGTNKKIGGVRFDVEADVLYYWKSDGTWAELAALPFTADILDPHVIKIVIDPSTTSYVRLRVDNTETDLSGYSLQSAAEASGPAVWLQQQLSAGASGQTEAFLNNIVMTVNEE